MEKSALQLGLEQLLENGDFNFKIQAYPGGGTYGKSCLGITGDSFDLFDLGFALARTDAMKDEDCMFKTKQEDNAGIVTMAGKLVPSPMQIIYWPEVEYSENELNEHD
jgi:hypothetical protein